MGDMRGEEERYGGKSGNVRGPGSRDWGWMGECMRIWGLSNLGVPVFGYPRIEHLRALEL